MKKIIIVLIAVFTISIALKAQESNNLKLIAGVRVNPLLIYDLNGNVNEKVLLHGELGALFNKKIYTSVGYTAAVNAVYNFNEYWFLGFDKKVPVSWVIAEEYNFNNKTFFIQTGPNIKLSREFQ